MWGGARAFFDFEFSMVRSDEAESRRALARADVN